MKKLVEKIKLFSVVFPSFLRSRHRSKLALTLYSTYLPIENTFLVSHTKQVKAVKASCQIHWFMGEEAGVKPGGGRDSYMEQTGMLVENVEFNP